MYRPSPTAFAGIGRSRRGATAVEFGLVALGSLTSLVMVIELSWQIATGAALDYAGREASRYAVTGSCSSAGITGPTPTNRSALIAAIATQSTGGFLKSSILAVTPSAYSTFASYQSSTGSTSGGGAGGNTVAYTLSYRQPYLTGLAQSILRTSSFTHVITIVVQNEPFITTCS